MTNGTGVADDVRIHHDAVSAVYDTFPLPAREQLLAVRQLIFRAAAAIEGVGAVEETLKWGEPAYLTSKSRSGSTIRLGWKASSPEQVAIYLNCQTRLVDTYRSLFPELHCEGNRAIILKLGEPMPEDVIVRCISMALTYHHDKRRQRTGAG